MTTHQTISYLSLHQNQKLKIILQLYLTMHHLIQDKVNLTLKKKKNPFLFVKFPTLTTKFDSLYEINLNLVSINSSN